MSTKFLSRRALIVIGVVVALLAVGVALWPKRERLPRVVPFRELTREQRQEFLCEILQQDALPILMKHPEADGKPQLMRELVTDEERHLLQISYP